ncbi:MAG: magnesium-translocating P-type ATPase [Nitrospirae bacterium]|nr:magnesium-translocating P-type ATPase [Nitrospirota bacterium]
MRSLFWCLPIDTLLGTICAHQQGLPCDEANRRVEQYGSTRLTGRRRSSVVDLLLAQFTNPIILILLVAAALSFLLGSRTDAAIVLAIVLVSGLLGVWQEYGATRAVLRLLSLVEIKVRVLRDGAPIDVALDEIVPGDVVSLAAGDKIPGDCRLLEAKDLFIDEATLTGESYPVEKTPGLLPPEAPLRRRTNSLFLGTHVVSGTGTALVVLTGTDTEFGQVSARLKLRPPETEFERGIRHFGNLLLEVTLLLVFSIFAINAYLARPVLESFLFSVALAVGLTPQLLPAIISVNLAHGASRMAQHRVVVKRLASIENLGSMNVFCSDKTGTLTEGVMRLQGAVDVRGAPSDQVFFYAYLNARYETGFMNPIDEAIRRHRALDLSDYQKLDEVPYDFVRKRLSILVSRGEARLLVTKGAVSNVLEVCSAAEMGEGSLVPIASIEAELRMRQDEWAGQGFRILGVAYRDAGTVAHIAKQDEAGMIFSGFLLFSDPPKPEIERTLACLEQLGITFKIVTGDSRLVAAHMSRQVGRVEPVILTGPELRQMSDEALMKRVNEVTIFADVEPNQKERIILALKKAGNVVGYGGDGINDASAMHAADVGISVANAVDVAKEAADIVLLDKDLSVLIEGVREGRRTFANTMKYVFMATSANFGNMFSMAGASLFLPFLPLLPKQILLVNLLTDVPEMTIAADAVDAELADKPRRWDIAFIRKFMITFGLISSVFDYLTFAVLIFFLHAGTAAFRTGWFLESVISAATIVLVIRTRRPFFKSRPHTLLVLATGFVVAATVLVPYSPLGGLFGLTPVPVSFQLAMGLLVGLYVMGAELTKKIFYHREAL